MTPIRELDLETLVLDKGSHSSFSDGACVMEAVAFVAGEDWTDSPECVSPVIRAFCISWNDTLDDKTRQRLKPYIPRVIGTNTGPADDKTRAWLACDWLVRTFTPAWLRRAGLDEDAVALEALPALTSSELCDAASPAIRKAQKKAYAAGDAAGDAAWAAAGDAAWAAAGAAARAAAGDAAGDAAWAAAGDAARAAARAAAGDALADTVSELQESAFALLDSMIAVGR